MALIFGTNSKDQLNGTIGADVIYGLDGNDTINGSAGGDVIDGGNGIDVVSYAASATGVDVSLATHLGAGGDAQGDTLFNIENLIGSSHSDMLAGDAGDNSLYGGAGNDYLYGGGGHDHLYGGDGNDTMFSDNGFADIDGGTGIDTADFSGRSAGLNANLSNGTVSYMSFFGLGPQNALHNVENLNGSAFRDFLSGDAGDNGLHGNGGDDLIYGGAGNDTIEGGTGADAMHGGDGIDMLTYEHSAAGVSVSLLTGYANGGEATGDTFDGVEWVKGSNHNDTLVGDAGDNVLYGLDGDDVLAGGPGGHDALYGGAGNDVLFSSGGEANIYGGSGIDTADFSGNQSGVNADLAMEKVWYGGNKTLPGQPENDLVGIENMAGTKFNDSLAGDAGNNVINGGGGNDWLSGGGGSDTFVFGQNFGKDTIFDFDGANDHIQIDHSIFANFADVHEHMAQVGDNVVIGYTHADTITLYGVQMNDIHASDFVFV